MYDYIRVEVASIEKDSAVIETGGIGYRIYSTAQSLMRLQAGQTANCTATSW